MAKILITNKMKMPMWLTKVFYIEYWPTWLLFLPSILYTVWMGIARFKITYFTATNPGIYLSGLYGESKMAILDRIPKYYVPTTLFIKKETAIETIFNEFNKNQFQYPVICKPDAGGRGINVSKIENEADLTNYFNTINADALIQTFLTEPMEAGVFYYYLPSGKEFHITSLTLKGFLEVIGNGSETIEKLLRKTTRGLNQLERLKITSPNLLNQIPNAHETVLVEPIGNHSRGTEFINGQKYITAKMESNLKELVQQIDGIYYGRFDVKFNTLEDLENCNFKVMELNGLTSEPTHIYASDQNLIKVWKTVFYHAILIKRISFENIKAGIKPATIKEVWTCFKDHLF